MVWALDLTIALCKSCHVVLRFGVKKRAFGLSVPTGRRRFRSHVRRIEWLVLAFSLGAGCRHLLGENDLDLEELDDITWLAPGSTVARRSLRPHLASMLECSQIDNVDPVSRATVWFALR